MVDKIQRIFIEIIQTRTHLEYLREEQLKPDDVIKDGKEYIDQFNTRQSINSYTKQLANKLKKLSYIEDTNPDISGPKVKRGLSTYVDIIFKHPEGLSKEELENYKYTIRFSDHIDKRKDKRTHKTSYVDVVGKKVKNLEKAGMKEFRTALSDIQDKIRKFEIEKFGKQKTFFDQTNECKLYIREE